MAEMLSRTDLNLLDLYLEQVLHDFFAEVRTRAETHNELLHFIRAVDARDLAEVRRAFAKAHGRSLGE
jgi:hypothetical protein